MNKIGFVFLSIIFLGILGGAIDSHAQLSFVNEDCYVSFIIPAVDSKLSLPPLTAFARQDSNEKRLTTFDKILNIPIGIVIGSLCGAAIGTAIPENNLGNTIKGFLIGASIGPFFTFETMSMSKKASNPLHKWRFKAGGNITFSNYHNTRLKVSYTLGIGRQYHLSKRISLSGEVFYTQRMFNLRSQKLCYAYYSKNVKSYDIDFSVSYISTSVQLNFKLTNLKNFNVGISLGPSLSFVVQDNTEFYFIRDEMNQDDFDFIYQTDEPTHIFGYPGIIFSLEFEYKKLLVIPTLHQAAIYTHQIFPLEDETKLTSFELNLGVKL